MQNLFACKLQMFIMDIARPCRDGRQGINCHYSARFLVMDFTAGKSEILLKFLTSKIFIAESKK